MEAESARPLIILADDNFTTQQVLRLSLAGEEIDIKCVESGEAALAEVEEIPPQILLANIYLPDMDGYELCRRLRECGHERIRVIMLVGAFQSFDEERARSVGCQHSLSKPFDTFALLSLVRQLLTSPPPIEEPEKESAFLFEPPLHEVGDQMVFDLSLEQCRSHSFLLEREITLGSLPEIEFTEVPEFSSPSAAESAALDRNLLLEKLSERVPEAIRKVLPEILKELDDTR